MKTTAIIVLAGSLLCGAESGVAFATGETVMTDHAHDFDFLAGKWRVHHRRLKERLANNHDWVEFEGTCAMWLTMNGHGTVDDNYLGLPSGGYRAMGVRGYDPKTQTWAIWWLDERNPHSIETPVIGNFQNGIGRFEANDTLNGKPIRVRFEWSRITAKSAHWEQSFSPDGGKTWELNWAMDFARVE